MPWITALFRRRRSNLRQYHVDLPDGTKRMFDLESRTTIINLLEVSLLSMSVPSQHHDMFCVLSPTVVNSDDRRWLRPEKSLKRELKGLLLPLTLHVQVLLYPRDHYSINHRVAKHLLYSQVKADFGDGKLKCTNEVMVQLAGLVAQAELGNYSDVTLQNSYMSQLNLISMSPRNERQAIDQHKIRSGLSMDECIDEFLSISETLKGYGTHKFDVHDDHDRSATIACGPLGVEVLMGAIQTIQLNWESVTTINVHSRIINFQIESAYNQTGHLYSFRCISTRLCKIIAVLCVNMRNYYCNSEVAKPTSKLRRLFSTKISRQRSSQYNIRRNGSAVSSFSNPRFRSSRSTPSFNAASQRSLRDKHHNHSIATVNPNDHSLLPTLHIHTSSNNSYTVPLVESERDPSVSPTTSIESPFRILPTLEESDTFSYKQTTHAPPFKKASTLPTNMNPSDIMNFNYLGGNGPNYPNHNSTSNNHTNNNNGYHYKRVESGGRRLNGYSNNHNNGAIDNFDCINELLDEGLEYSSNVRRKERVSIGGEVDRRRVFPAESSSHNYSRTRSNTLQNPKRHGGGGGGGERRISSSSARPFHRSTNSDPSKLHFASSTSLYSGTYNNVGVASLANQLSLATLSQDSSYIDPHIKSLVFGSSSQADATEL